MNRRRVALWAVLVLVPLASSSIAGKRSDKKKATQASAPAGAQPAPDKQISEQLVSNPADPSLYAGT
jgi:hypothetical protein